MCNQCAVNQENFVVDFFLSIQQSLTQQIFVTGINDKKIFEKIGELHINILCVLIAIACRLLQRKSCFNFHQNSKQ